MKIANFIFYTIISPLYAFLWLLEFLYLSFRKVFGLGCKGCKDSVFPTCQTHIKSEKLPEVEDCE